MPEEPFKGIDCRRTFKKPRRKIRIAPRRGLLKPGQVITLHAGDAPFDCDPGCYWWILASGKGTLSPEFGKSTNYRAPEITTNVNCEASAAIALFIGQYHLDTALFTINTFDDGERAYEILSLDREIEYLAPHYTWPVPGLPAPPAGADSNHARLYTWARHYTCRDKLIGKSSWSTRDFFWTFNHAQGKWVFIYTVTGAQFTGFPQAIAYYDEIDKDRDGEIIDRRSRRDKGKGCCPLKLMEKELEPVDKPLPYY